MHRIYISPSTFEYPSELDNLLWTDTDDISLLSSIKAVKRESRMARDNSEDALTWNVFRYFERTDQLSALLSFLLGRSISSPELIYWSYAQVTKGIWPDLVQACGEFGEHLARRSEPDLIVASDEALIWIEAKLTASNKTKPSSPEKTKRYLDGGNGWYKEAFRSDYQTIAIREEKYELMRFWLLGSWAAAQLGRDFYLVSLVLRGRDTDIVQQFKPLLRTSPERNFVHFTWEDICESLGRSLPPDPDEIRLTSYFENKTIGYDQTQRLRPAFSLSGPSISKT